jgi:hypothetical protein
VEVVDVPPYFIEADEVNYDTGSYTKTEDTDLAFHVVAPKDSLSGVTVNETLLTEDTDYTVKGETTTIVLVQSYLESLPDGIYEIKVDFSNGYSTQGQFVVSTPVPSTPNQPSMS